MHAFTALAIVKRLWDSMTGDYIGLIAAGIAFYFLLAAFPALAALVSLYGIFSDPSFVASQLDLLENFLPADALSILAEQARAIASANTGALGFSFALGVLLSIYAATKGVRALIKGLNIAYNRKETRNIFILNMTAFALTMIMMIYLLTSLTLVAAVPFFFSFIPWDGGWLTPALYWLRWVLLFSVALVGLQILYHYGPADMPAAWQWFSWGGGAATVLWVLISSLFSLFVSNFSQFNETYGSLGAVVILLLWLWMSALTILVGAEINAMLNERRSGRKLPPREKKKEAL